MEEEGGGDGTGRNKKAVSLDDEVFCLGLNFKFTMTALLSASDNFIIRRACQREISRNGPRRGGGDD